MSYLKCSLRCHKIDRSKLKCSFCENEHLSRYISTFEQASRQASRQASKQTRKEALHEQAGQADLTTQASKQANKQKTNKPRCVHGPRHIEAVWKTESSLMRRSREEQATKKTKRSPCTICIRRCQRAWHLLHPTCCISPPAFHCRHLLEIHTCIA